MDAESPAPAACPPHHWLIVEVMDGRQQWTCQRCGVLQDHDAAVAYRWPGGQPQRLPKRLKHPSD